LEHDPQSLEPWLEKNTHRVREAKKKRQAKHKTRQKKERKNKARAPDVKENHTFLVCCVVFFCLFVFEVKSKSGVRRRREEVQDRSITGRTGRRKETDRTGHGSESERRESSDEEARRVEP
jgi:hypothetical protein